MYPITLTKNIEDIEICGVQLGDLDCPDFKYPWELIIWFRKDIEKILQLSIINYQLQEKNVFVGKNVKITEYVIFDTSAGQIIIDHNTKIGSFSYIQGPCYIGENCEIMPHSQIRKNTSIGHTCKIGGEVSGSIFQAFTNKAHYGFIGDSYIGSWVNLGAGTSCSNLKNTYGPVRINYQNKKVDTGEQFLGCIIGDYAKAAINTSIYTGKIIGVCAQLFGIIDENVPSFVMKMPNGSQKEFELKASIRMQKRMFQRRGIKQSQKDIKMLERVFKQTKGQRSV